MPESGFSPLQSTSAGFAAALHAIAEEADHEISADSPCVMDVGVIVKVIVGAGGVILIAGHVPYVSNGSPLSVTRSVYVAISAINGLLYCSDHSYSVRLFFSSVIAGAVSAIPRNNPETNPDPLSSCCVVPVPSAVCEELRKAKGVSVSLIRVQSPSLQSPAVPVFLNARRGVRVPPVFFAETPIRRRSAPSWNCAASVMTISPFFCRSLSPHPVASASLPSSSRNQ